MPDVSITDLIADLRNRDSLTSHKGVFGIAADALEESEQEAVGAEKELLARELHHFGAEVAAQQAKDLANNLAVQVAQLGRELSERTMQRNEWASRMMELANITAERATLTEQLAAAQAVIAEADARVLNLRESDANAVPLAVDVHAILAQSHTDTLEAVKADAYNEGTRATAEFVGENLGIIEGFARGNGVALVAWLLQNTKAPSPYSTKTEGEKP